MSVARPLSILAVALLVAVPAAQAYAQPVFYFLKDAPGPMDEVPEAPLPIPLPVSTPTPDPFPGLLDPYNPKMPNAPNATTGKERLVVVGQELVLPVQFVTPANHTHADRLKGSIFVGLWAGKSGTYQANLTATLYEVPAEGDPIALANASLNLDFNQSTAPDPTAFIPQNQTDPQAILFYEVGQVLPLIYHPPALFVLGPLDMPFSNTSAFAIGFSLTQGSSPVPLPAGAFASIDYDAVLSPSFIYVPWYAPDPPRVTPTRSSSFGAGTSTRHTGGHTIGGGTTAVADDDKDSPGFALPIALAALLAVAALAARRRTK
jgi:PGF-CTERM protein